MQQASSSQNPQQQNTQPEQKAVPQQLGLRKRSEHSQQLLQTTVINNTGNGAPVLQQKRISGSQQQILAAIASKLHSKKQKHSQHQQNNSPSNTTTTGQHKHLKVKETATQRNYHQAAGSSHNNQAKIAGASAAVVASGIGGAVTTRTKHVQQQPAHTKGKQASLNTELAALCSAKNDDGLKQAVTQSSGTKAKSGGVRNTNMVQGLVGTPSATQRLATQQSALSNKKAQFVGKYQLQEIVGRGAFGRVYKGLNTQTNELVAIKMIPLIRLKTDCKKSIIDEINLMRRLDHKNIVKYIETVQSGHQLCIVMEFIEGGSLEYLYKKFGCFSETLVAIYIKQVLKGLEYLHRQTVIHRDIKGGNILTTKAGVVKLADFGVATKLTEAEKHNSFAGTPHWMAPEVIEMSGNVTAASDIWSVGCTVYELLKGSPPNFDLNKFCAMIKNVREPMPIPDVVSVELRDFLKKCFTKDPAKRPSASELLEHEWFKKQFGGNKLARILEKQQLPQEVTNTIRIHNDSENEKEESSTKEGQLKTTAAAEPGKKQTLSQPQLLQTTKASAEAISGPTVTTQQKVKNVAKLLTRQNVNLHNNANLNTSQMPIHSQPNILVKTATTERHQVTTKTASSQNNNVHHNDPQTYSQHPIIYPASAVNKTTGAAASQTTVSLKKAIQDKLTAQALKQMTTNTGAKGGSTTVTIELQKSKSAMATKNHQVMQSALIAQPQQPVIKEASTTTNRANSASQVAKSGISGVGIKPSYLAAATKTIDTGAMTAPGMDVQQVIGQISKFYPASTTHSSQQNQLNNDGRRPQTSLAQNSSKAVVTQNTFGSASGSALHPQQQNQSNSQIIGHHHSSAVALQQTTGGQQAINQTSQGGGALIDLRGNKRLFHLSRKMIGNVKQQSIPVMVQSREEISRQGTSQQPHHVLQTQSTPGVYTQADQQSQSNQIPESQQVTEYSPDQDHPRNLSQLAFSKAVQKAAATGTEERKAHQSHHVLGHAGGGQSHGHSMRPQKQQQLSLTDEQLQPNFFRQWTEQTELTANVVKQGGGNNGGAILSSPCKPFGDGVDDEENELRDGKNELEKDLMAHEDTQQSPLNKLAKQNLGGQMGAESQLSRKPNWPIKIYQQQSIEGSGPPGEQGHQPQRSLILNTTNAGTFENTTSNSTANNARIQLNKSAEISSQLLVGTSGTTLTNARQQQHRQQLQLSSDLSDNNNQHHQQQQLLTNNQSALSCKAGLPFDQSQLSMPPSQGSSYYQTMNKQQLSNPAVLITSTTPTHNFPTGAPTQQLLNMTTIQHKNESSDFQQQQQQQSSHICRSAEKQHHQVSQQQRHGGRTAISSLSQNYPSNTNTTANGNGNGNGGASRQRPVTNNLQPLVPHQVSLSATGFHALQVGPQTVSMTATGLSQHHAMHKSLQFGVNALHTAKASQKQLRLRSPLGGGALQPGTSGGGYNHNNGHDYSHTIDVNNGGGGQMGAPNTNQQRDESDLGDLDDEDESRTLFQQFVQRTNLGLNRKPSGPDSLSGTSATLLPQNMAKKTNQIGGSSKGISSQSKLLMQDLKHATRQAAEAGHRQGAEIKRQLFLIDIVKSGDTQLMQLIVDNSTHQCCAASSDDQGDNMTDQLMGLPHQQKGDSDDGFDESDDDDDIVDSGSHHHRQKHHSCERSQFSKSPHQLTSEICHLLKQVANGSSWSHLCVESPEDTTTMTANTALMDAFKEAFLSQLSYFDLLQLLGWKDGQSGQDSVAYAALQVINSLAEANVSVQRQFMTAGLIEKLKHFASQGEDLSLSREIKVEVAYFIGQVFQHSKELIASYMGAQGYHIQLDFLRHAARQLDLFRDNIDLVMIAIDSILVMFEEVQHSTHGTGNQAKLHASSASINQVSQSNNKKLANNGPQCLQAGMVDSDLAKTLTQAGLLPLLTRQIPNFIQSALNSTDQMSEDQSSTLTYLERIFDILINMAICGQHMVRQELCSEPVLGANLTQFIQQLLQASQSPIRLQVARWYVKLIIALTSQQTIASSASGPSADILGVTQGASQIVIFELLGQRHTIALLSHLVQLFTYHQQSLPQAGSSSTGQPAQASYLATLYETLKLLNLLAKMSPSRCEQACTEGQVVFGLKNLLATLEINKVQGGGGAQDNQNSLTMSRSKKNRLTNTSLQLVNELVAASVVTRTALLDNGIPALLLQLYQYKATMPTTLNSHHLQKQSHGRQSLSLQSANSNLRQSGANAAQDQEIVGRILDIFVLWVQQDDQTGQVMQEILADQHSLEVIFSLIGQPRRHKAQALLAFFNALNRILLASDRVIEALLGHVHLIVHLSAILVFLSRQLSGDTSSRPAHDGQSTAGLGQTGATPNSLRHGVPAGSSDDLSTQMMQQQAVLAQQWQDCFKNGSDEQTARVNNKSRDRKGSHNMLLTEQSSVSAPSLGTQQTTQILKELLEIFQLLVQAFQQYNRSTSNNFLTQLRLGATIQEVVKIATDANLVILQSMSSQLLKQIVELPSSQLMLSNGLDGQGHDDEVPDEDFDHVSTEQEHYSASHSALTKKPLTPNSAAMFQQHKQAINTNFTSAASAIRPSHQQQSLVMFSAPQSQQHHPQKMFKGGYPLKQAPHPSKQQLEQ